jgi:CRISPR-associated protein Cmr1
MNEVRLTLMTKTPLWTGGIRGTADRLHETGIMGSLRWWFEAIVRGLGGEACDPTTHSCPDKEGRICDVCAVFGTTGWKRLFTSDWQSFPNDDNDKHLSIKVQNNRGWYLRRGLYHGQLSGCFRQTRIPVFSTNGDELIHSLSLPLSLIESWGSLGAKTSQGYGVVDFTSFEPYMEMAKALSYFGTLKNRTEPKRKIGLSADLPRLDEFFFAKIQLDLSSEESLASFIEARSRMSPSQELQWYLESSSDKNSILPLAPIVRYHLRNMIRENFTFNGFPNAPARWDIMGVINGKYHASDFGKLDDHDWYCSSCNKSWERRPSKNVHSNCGRPHKRFLCKTCKTILAEFSDQVKKIDRRKSKIQFSLAYPVAKNRYEFRIWGWLPPYISTEVTRTQVLTKLRDWFGVSDPFLAGTWQHASQGKLWSKSRCNFSSNQPRVMWMEKDSQESTEAFIQRLLSNEVVHE